MGLSCRTKNNDSPRGKAKVFFSCYGSDFAKYSDKIFHQLHEIVDCAIYFYPPDEQVETDDRYTNDLLRMDLIVIPVTYDLLCNESRTLDIDFLLARECNIPVLPLVQEEGLEGLFNERFGHLQYLHDTSDDHTSIPYMEKLEKFVLFVLTDNDLTRDIRKAFCAKLFLSYRKKDREHAQRLMSLIHGDERFRDVAIWYDEFLTPGENYDKNILEEIKSSDLFVMAVTPGLLEPDNYVMTEEYPAAGAVVPVVPVEMVSTDKEELKRYYPNIPDPIKDDEEETLRETLQNHLGDRLKVNDEENHIFLMGMAYFSGIEVERDVKKAIELLKEAADRKVPAAALKLANIYAIGDHVPRNLYKSKRWLHEYTKMLKEKYEVGNREEDAVNYYWSLKIAGKIFGENGDNNTALMQFIKAVTVATRLCKEMNYSKTLLLESYRNVSRTAEIVGVEYLTLSHAERAAKLMYEIYENNHSMETRHGLVDCFVEMGDIFCSVGKQKKALPYYEKAAEVLEVISKAEQLPKWKVERIDLYIKLEDCALQLKDHRSARNYKKLANALVKECNNDEAGFEAKQWHMLAHFFFAKKPDMARKLMEKAVADSEQKVKNSNSIYDRLILQKEYAMLGTVWEMLADKALWRAKEKSDKARHYHKLASEQARALVDDYPFAFMQYTLVESYIDMGTCYDPTISDDFSDALYSDYKVPKKKQADLETAYSCYMKALVWFDKINAKLTLPMYQKLKLEILKNCGRVCKVLGMYDNAVEYYREHLNIYLAMKEKDRGDDYEERLADASFYVSFLTDDGDLLESARNGWMKIYEKEPKNWKLLMKIKEAEMLLKILRKG